MRFVTILTQFIERSQSVPVKRYQVSGRRGKAQQKQNANE